MGVKILSFLILFLLAMPVASAQEMKIIYVQGKCIDYNIKIEAEGLERGCYDLKIDSPDGRVGEVYDPDGGWKSSYYYLKNGYCTGKENVFRFRAKTREDFEIGAKIRDRSQTITTEYKKLF